MHEVFVAPNKDNLKVSLFKLFWKKDNINAPTTPKDAASVAVAIPTYMDPITAVIKTITGNITFTNNSATITGEAGVSIFTTELKTGDFIYLDNEGLTNVYQILSIETDTSLTLKTVYSGTTTTNTAKYYNTDYSGSDRIKNGGIGSEIVDIGCYEK